MEKKVAYTVLEIGWEYDDESYHTGNYGETYEAPNEIFLDKEKAKAEWLKREIKAYKGNNLAQYTNGDDFASLLVRGVDEDDVIKLFKEAFDIDLDLEDNYYEIEVPSSANDEDIAKLISMTTLRFNKLHEITITE